MTDAETKLRQLADKYGVTYSELRTEAPEDHKGPHGGATTLVFAALVDGHEFDMRFHHADGAKRPLDQLRSDMAEHVEFSLRNFREKHPMEGSAT